MNLPLADKVLEFEKRLRAGPGNETNSFEIMLGDMHDLNVLAAPALARALKIAVAALEVFADEQWACATADRPEAIRKMGADALAEIEKEMKSK